MILITMRNRFFIFWLMICLFGCKEVSQTTNNSVNNSNISSSPNVIVILLDDAGYVDFGFMGSKDLDTPEIDKLAANGVVFTDAHVSSTVCAPSRAGLITGQYQQRFGFEANDTGDKTSGDIGLAKEVSTIADAFKENNYATTAIGKWHLGGTKHNHPNQRGFDDFFGFLAGGRSYFPMQDPSSMHMLQHNGEQVQFEGYLTDVLGDYAVEFVEEKQTQPFFMYLSYNAVHTPMEAKKDDLLKYKDHPRKELAAMTWSLDQNIGKLRNKLNDLGILDNTLIFFLSDNGGAHNNQSSTGNLKGWKGNEFEGGHRVPFVVSWPDKIEKGWVFNGLTSSLDIFATSIAATEIERDQNQILDGVNLLPFLTKKQTGNPHQALFWRKLEESAARLDNFKWIGLEDYGSVLYDLKEDIGESKDLSETDLENYNRLTKAHQNWEKDMMQPLWGEPTNWMEVTYHIHKQLMQNKKALYHSPQERKLLVGTAEE